MAESYLLSVPYDDARASRMIVPDARAEFVLASPLQMIQDVAGPVRVALPVGCQMVENRTEHLSAAAQITQVLAIEPMAFNVQAMAARLVLPWTNEDLGRG